jgi:hypothetical protein
MSTANLFNTVKTRIKQHMVLLSITHLLERIGIKIAPYYLTIESLPAETDIKFDAGLNSLNSRILTPPEVTAMYSSPELRNFSDTINKRLSEGCLCFALVQDTEVAAFMWCNLQYCESDFIKFKLQDNEAYLFGARTMNKFRGSNMAPFLRMQLYRYLTNTGRTKYYSITEYFNKPARHFKNKVKAKHLRLSVYINIFNRIKWNIKLREYVIQK